MRFFQLILRPFERFQAQWIAVSTQPSAFVRERIRLGDTTNFLRAAGFFISAISTAFLAEAATLYLLGIGNLTEPYYWLFILLTSTTFVLFCFLLIRLVAPLSFKDVLHLSLYPIGAGVFTGAALALVASAVVGLLVEVGYIPEIKYDPTQWGEVEQLTAVNQRALNDCLKQESLGFTILAAGLQEAFTRLKPPIDNLSYLRPAVTVLYLVIAACFFMAAVERRKVVVFSLVLLAALVATGVNALSASVYLNWKIDNSSCREKLPKLGADRVAESALKNFAGEMQAYLETRNLNDDVWNISVRAEGRSLIYTYRLKGPIADAGLFQSGMKANQKAAFEAHCFKNPFFRIMNVTQTHTFYSAEGKWLWSFSISPADCPQG